MPPRFGGLRAAVGRGYDSSHDRGELEHRADRRLVMADELTFFDVVDFLVDHEGQKVYVEIGTRDPESTEQPAEAFILQAVRKPTWEVKDATEFKNLGLAYEGSYNPRDGNHQNDSRQQLNLNREVHLCI